MGAMGTGGDQDMENTSLGKSIRYFRSSFLHPLLKSCKIAMEPNSEGDYRSSDIDLRDGDVLVVAPPGLEAWSGRRIWFGRASSILSPSDFKSQPVVRRG